MEFINENGERKLLSSLCQWGPKNVQLLQCLTAVHNCLASKKCPVAFHIPSRSFSMSPRTIYSFHWSTALDHLST